eukprot:jgi/Psemu1/286700/fgenesh1_pg.149_\
MVVVSAVGQIVIVSSLCAMGPVVLEFMMLRRRTVCPGQEELGGCHGWDCHDLLPLLVVVLNAKLEVLVLLQDIWEEVGIISMVNVLGLAFLGTVIPLGAGERTVGVRKVLEHGIIKVDDETSAPLQRKRGHVSFMFQADKSRIAGWS